MEIIKTIAFVFSTISYAMMAFFTGYAYSMLRRHGKELHAMKQVCDKTLATTLVLNVKSSLDELNRLNQMLSAAVDREDYEAAEELRKSISWHEKETVHRVEQLRRQFGDLIDLRIEKIGGVS